MALLSQLIRNVAITGSTERVNAWFADRQGGRWAEQTVRGAFPELSGRPHGAPRARPEDTLRNLQALRARGVISDAELEGLRARLGV